MRLLFFTFSLLFASFSFAQKKQSQWKSEFDFGDGISMTTFLKIETYNNKFTITSPENADVRMLGNIKAKLARILGKAPKKGVIITIKGQQIKDSLFGISEIPLFGEVKFKGTLLKNELSGVIIKNDTSVVAQLHGKKSIENKINFQHLFSAINDTTINNIYSHKALEAKEWRKFKKHLKKLTVTAQDDIEFFIGFNLLSSRLSFSHYRLLIQQDKSKFILEEDELYTPNVFFEKKNNTTAYLKIQNFSTTQRELAQVSPAITNNKIKDLIIDLRNNGGGGIDAAFEFAQFIAFQDINIGFFLTNKLNYSGFQPQLFGTLPQLQPSTSEEFGNYLKKEKGAKLIFKKSDNPLVFSGNIYVLTNKGTGSTCEPLIYALKNILGATVIGEKTAGAMLAAAPFKIYDKYKLFLPIGDFYTYDGVRLDQLGVSPTIETASKEALNKAMELISNKKMNKWNY